jgi:hypothetical protein
MAHKKIAHLDIQYDNNARVNFRDVAVLPTEFDNCAICTRKIEKDTIVQYTDNVEFSLSHTILEGIPSIKKSRLKKKGIDSVLNLSQRVLRFYHGDYRLVMQLGIFILVTKLLSIYTNK